VPAAAALVAGIAVTVAGWNLATGTTSYSTPPPRHEAAIAVLTDQPFYPLLAVGDWRNSSASVAITRRANEDEGEGLFGELGVSTGFYSPGRPAAGDRVQIVIWVCNKGPGPTVVSDPLFEVLEDTVTGDIRCSAYRTHLTDATPMIHLDIEYDSFFSRDGPLVRYDPPDFVSTISGDLLEDPLAPVSNELEFNGQTYAGAINIAFSALAPPVDLLNPDLVAQRIVPDPMQSTPIRWEGLLQLRTDMLYRDTSWDRDASRKSVLGGVLTGAGASLVVAAGDRLWQRMRVRRRS
jgi:hypothetical protein